MITGRDGLETKSEFGDWPLGAAESHGDLKINRAYYAYVAFFSDKIHKCGVVKTMEDYIFSPAANGNNSDMLFRLFGGV